MEIASPEALESRLLAHRQLLALLIAALEAHGEAGAILDFLEERQTLQDGQEDPGAVPAKALTFSLAMSDEFREVERPVRERQQARS